ncbi:ABC-type glycerol-3-phosphate transport system substrate-binding protein [Bradyrhizobium sp. i1.4.4]
MCGAAAVHSRLKQEMPRLKQVRSPLPRDTGRAIVISASSLLRILAAFIVLAMPLQARAATDIALWHAMSGELGRQLEKLAADFNASQSDYRIVPAYKGNYTETVTAAIFAFRSRSQPAIVQVNEVATATMTAAKGAIYIPCSP